MCIGRTVLNQQYRILRPTCDENQCTRSVIPTSSRKLCGLLIFGADWNSCVELTNTRNKSHVIVSGKTIRKGALTGIRKDTVPSHCSHKDKHESGN